MKLCASAEITKSMGVKYKCLLFTPFQFSFLKLRVVEVPRKPHIHDVFWRWPDHWPTMRRVTLGEVWEKWKAEEYLFQLTSPHCSGFFPLAAGCRILRAHHKHALRWKYVIIFLEEPPKWIFGIQMGIFHRGRDVEVCIWPNVYCTICSLSISCNKQ